MLIRLGRELSSGWVEVDETCIGGQEAGLVGGRAKGRKALVAVAVEVRERKGYGRWLMAVIPDAKAATLKGFLAENIAPAATVVTDGWSGYLGIDQAGYCHDRRSQGAARARGRTSRACCPGCTGSLPWPSDGCWEPTRAP